MKRHLLALALALAPAPAGAQLMTLGYGAGGAGAAGPVTTYAVAPLLLAGSTNLSASTNAYFPLQGGGSSVLSVALLTLAQAQTPMPTYGVISNLRAQFNTGITTGTYTVTLMQNGSTTALSCAASTGVQSCTSAALITVNLGDALAWQVAPSGTPTAQPSAFQISATFASGVGNEAPILAGGTGTASPGGFAQYIPFQNSFNPNLTESASSTLIPFPGTIDHLYYTMDAASTGGGQYQIRIFKNGATTTLTCTTAINGQSCQDLVDSFTVVAGDTISVQICPSNSSTCPAGTQPSGQWPQVGVRWQAGGTNNGTANSYPLMSISAVQPTSAATLYGPVVGSFSNVSTETDLNTVPLNYFVLSQLTASISPSPSTSKTFTLHQNAAVPVGSNINCTITNPATTCTSSFLFDKGKLFSLADSTDIQVTGTDTSVTWMKYSVVANASSYVGPADVSASFFAGGDLYYGTRAFSAGCATQGCNIMNLTRASDSHNCDVYPTSSGDMGNVVGCSTPADNGTAVATWCNATTCNVVEWYTQQTYTECTGSTQCHISQATAAKQPVLTFNCIGGKPCVTFTGSSSQFLQSGTTSAMSTSGTQFFAAIADRTANFSTGASISGQGTGASPCCANGYGATTNQAVLNNGTSNAFQTASDSVMHSLFFLMGYSAVTTKVVGDGLVSVDNVLGALQSSNGTRVPSTSGTVTLGASNATTQANFLTGNIAEWFNWGNATLTTAALTALCHNQYTYYGMATSC